MQDKQGKSVLRETADRTHSRIALYSSHCARTVFVALRPHCIRRIAPALYSSHCARDATFACCRPLAATGGVCSLSPRRRAAHAYHRLRRSLAVGESSTIAVAIQDACRQRGHRRKSLLPFDALKINSAN